MYKKFLILSLILFSLCANVFSQAKEDILEKEKKINKKYMLYSALVPGLGQYKLEKKWKALFYFSVNVGLAANLYREDYLADKNYDKYLKARELGDEGKQVYYYSLYSTNYDNRQTTMWYLGVFYLLNVLDVYVDLHLKNFNKEIIDISYEEDTYYMGVNFACLKKKEAK